MKKIFFFTVGILMSIDVLAQPTYQWAKGVGGTGNDRGNSIATDASGNVYVCGNFSGTADFDPGPGTANMISLGFGDIFFAKYDANGNYIWAKRIGSTVVDAANSIVLDGVGNIYIIGLFGGAADFDPGPGTANLSPVGTNTDIFFAKYDGNGNYIFAKSIGSTGSDAGQSIVVDAGGNIYVTGSFFNTADFDPGPAAVNLTSLGSGDIFFAKYNGSGNYLWAKSVGSATNDIGYGITVDASGNSYIAGLFSNTTDFDPGTATVNLVAVGGNDAFFAKYDVGGNYIWAKNMGSTTNDICRSIAVDAGGNTYVTGFFTGTADFDPGAGIVNLVSTGSYDAFFAKYDGTGNYLWAKRIGSTGSSGTEGHNIIFDAGGNVYVCGNFGGTADFDPGPGTTNLSATNSDIFFGKYDGSGNYLWAKSIGGSNSDYCRSVALDAAGNVYITGNFALTADFDPGPGTANLVSAGTDDLFFAKYSSCAIPSTPGTISGNTTVCSGSSSNYSVVNDPSATSYSWTLPGGWSGTSITNNISTTAGATSGSITVIATNTCGSSPQQTLNVTVSPCTGLSSLVSSINEIRLYPNPTSGKITIYGISSMEKIEVYNMLGELIYIGEIENENFEIDLTKKSSGMYFIRIGTEIKKIIKE